MAAETVQIGQDENSAAVRFAKVVGGKDGAKGPKYRAFIALSGAMCGLCLEAPIFQDGNTGQYSVGLPGGRFAALKPNAHVLQDGAMVYTADDPAGVAKLDRWQPAILTAFHAFLTDGKAEQRIAL